ncbi:MAG: hypothetical protein HYV07_27055 [Deltaproteobacteria bacterium]|nr:hypothetical protein [Deltaproteobacteria bacterium]
MSSGGPSKLDASAIRRVRGGAGGLEPPADVVDGAARGSTSGTVSFGDLHDRWIGEWLGPNPMPPEADSTCSDCVMRPEGEPEPGRVYFDAVTRCCTFVPIVPNFLAGAALLDTTPEAAEGRQTVLARIARRRAVSPLGLERTLGFSLKYRHTVDAFGRKGSLRCPHHLDDGRCGIWRHRESTCSTWFCKPAKGTRSLALWRAVQSFFGVIERQLAFWCVRRVGLANESVTEAFLGGNHPLWTRTSTYSTHLFGSQLDGPRKSSDPLGMSTRSEHRELWGEWDGREGEFYERCAELASALSFNDLRRIAGDELSAEMKKVEAALAAIRGDAVPPDGLCGAELDLIQLRRRPEGEWALLSPYRSYDPFEVPKELLEALGEFDGRPTEAVLDELVAQRGLSIDPVLLRRLLDFGFLLPR